MTMTEEDLKKYEEGFYRLADALPHMVWTAPPNGENDYYNQRWFDFTGFSRAETFQHEWWIRLVHPDDRARVLAAWHKVLANPTLYEVEYRLWEQATGQYRWFLTRATPVYNLQGNVIKWFGTCTNIDDRKQAESKLLFHASLAQNITDAVVATNLDGTILLWNSAAEALYGWKQEEVQGKQVNDVLHTHYTRVKWEEWVADILKTGSWRGEIRQQRQDGTWLDIQGGVSLVRDVNGQITGLVGLFRDITRSKQIAHELAESEQQLHAAIDVAGLGHWRFDPQTNLFDCSARCKAYLGFSPATMVSLDQVCARVRPPEQGSALLDTLKKQELFEKEYQIQWPDGSLHWLAVSGRGQYDKQGRPIGMAGVTLDITERKLGEQRKDTFISMASHELKTPLTTIKGFTQLLKRQAKRLGLPEQMAVTLAKVEKQANTLTKLVNELLDVSKMQAGQLEYTWGKVEIDQLLKDVIETVQPTSPQHSIRVHGETGCTLTGDRSRLEQVFINLLTNALKYSPQADRVDIFPACSEQSVEICIRDYGQGIPPEEQKHIFERFYRIDRGKNQKVEGLGMGLYVAGQIVEKHGGQITVDSKEGEGATFCVRLPLSHPLENAR